MLGKGKLEIPEDMRKDFGNLKEVTYHMCSNANEEQRMYDIFTKAIYKKAKGKGFIEVKHIISDIMDLDQLVNRTKTMVPYIAKDSKSTNVQVISDKAIVLLHKTETELAIDSWWHSDKKYALKLMNDFISQENSSDEHPVMVQTLWESYKLEVKIEDKLGEGKIKPVGILIKK